MVLKLILYLINFNKVRITLMYLQYYNPYDKGQGLHMFSKYFIIIILYDNKCLSKQSDRYTKLQNITVISLILFIFLVYINTIILLLSV